MITGLDQYPVIAFNDQNASVECCESVTSYMRINY